MTSSVENRGNQVNVDKFLEHSYHPTGSILRLQDHTEFYAVGNPRCKNGVVMIPDTMGWNSGRIRNIADFFGENGFFVVIPKLSGSTTEGEGPSIFEASGIGEYMKGLTFNANLKPKINSLTNFLKDEGVEKISLIGFSWGGWVVVNVLADPELSSKFVCAALPHPSINLEERMFGGSLPDLFSRVERPLLLLPAKGDPEEYNSYVKLMRYKLPSSDIISSFRNLEHGFLLRGRIEDREIQEGVKQSMQQILSYFRYHCQTNLNDFVREAVEGSVLGGKSEAGRHEPVSGGTPSLGQQTQDTWSRWSQQAADTMNRWTQSIQDTTGYYQQQASDSVERTQDQARQLGQQVQEGYEQTKEKLGEYGQQVQDTASNLTERAKENIHIGQERAKEGYEQTKEKLGEYGEQAQQGWDQTKQQAGETYEKSKEKVGEYGQRAQEGLDQTKQQAGETYEKSKEKVGEYGQRAQEGWDQTKQKAGEHGQQMQQSAHDTFQQGKEKGNEYGQRAQDTARQTGQRIGENMKEGGEKLKEKSGSPKTSPKSTLEQHKQTHRP